MNLEAVENTFTHFFIEWSIVANFKSFFKKRETYLFYFLNMEKMYTGISVLMICTTVVIHSVPRWFPQESLWLPVGFSRLLCIYGWKEPSFLGIDLLWSRARVPEVAE